VIAGGFRVLVGIASLGNRSGPPFLGAFAASSIPFVFGLLVHGPARHCSAVPDPSPIDDSNVVLELFRFAPAIHIRMRDDIFQVQRHRGKGFPC
jgi:hypothetical protein